MRVYGEPLGSLTHIDVHDAQLAVMLADADGRLGHRDGSGRLGAAYLQDGILHLSSQPGGTSTVYSITSVDDLIAALHEPVGLSVPGTMALHLDVDLQALVDGDSTTTWQPDQIPVVTLNESLAGLNVMMIVGPGVVRANSVSQLQQCVRQGGFRVLNTFGAKGVERWDSPYHLGTAGLQTNDWERAGCYEADVILTSGLDHNELPPSVLARSVVQDVPSSQLQALTQSWPTQAIPDADKPLVTTINQIIHPTVESDQEPLAAARAALHLSGALPEDGVVVADPGRAGWWIARTLPTGIPGSCILPSLETSGFAAAAALVCALEGRPYLAVTDLQHHDADNNFGVSEHTDAIIELAHELGVPIALQVWGDAATSGGHEFNGAVPSKPEIRSAMEHVELVQSLVGDNSSSSSSNESSTRRASLHPVAVDYSVGPELVVALGDPIPWTF